MRVKKQLLVLLLTNPCIKEWGNTYPITEASGNKYAFYCISFKRSINRF